VAASPIFFAVGAIELRASLASGDCS